jgi:Co/Zn/Cd efflux system component
MLSLRQYAICAGRVRMLAGFANAVILMFVALNIVLEAGVHIMGGGHDVTTHRLLPISIIGLVVNLVGLLFVHEAHNHHQHGGQDACLMLHAWAAMGLHKLAPAGIVQSPMGART